MPEITSPRRRFQFGLRSLLAAMGVIGVLCAWWVRPTTIEDNDGPTRIVCQVRYDRQKEPYNDGRWRIYDGDDQLRADGNFHRETPYGWWEYRDEQGRKVLAGDSRGGKRVGLWTAWHANGQKQSETRYADGRPHGQATTWWENGEVRASGQYAAGRRDGVWEFHDEAGVLSSRGHYVDGREDGAWLAWNADGSAAAGRQFSEGREVHFDAEQIALHGRRLASGTLPARLEALWALDRIGRPAAVELTAALGNSEPEIRSRAASTLGRLRAKTSLPALIRALDDADWHVQDSAAAALANFGPRAMEAIPRLRQLAAAPKTDKPSIRPTALATLHCISPDDLNPLRELLGELRDSNQLQPAKEPQTADDSTDRLNVVVLHPAESEHTLARSLVFEQALLPGLEKLLQDSDAAIAAAAAMALGRFRRQEEQVVPPLMRALADPRPEVRIGACIGLATLGRRAMAADPALRELAEKDSDPRVRDAAKNAVPRIHGHGFGFGLPAGGAGTGYF